MMATVMFTQFNDYICMCVCVCVCVCESNAQGSSCSQGSATYSTPANIGNMENRIPTYILG